MRKLTRETNCTTGGKHNVHFTLNSKTRKSSKLSGERGLIEHGLKYSAWCGKCGITLWGHATEPKELKQDA